MLASLNAANEHLQIYLFKIIFKSVYGKLRNRGANGDYSNKRNASKVKGKKKSVFTNMKLNICKFQTLNPTVK